MVAFSRYYPFDSFKLFYYFSRIVGFRAFYLYHILMPDKFKNYLNLISLLIIIFFAASIVWYSPVLFKGYSTMNLWNTSLLARNLAGAGVFGVEDNLNIVLASSLIKERAQISTEGNKLTPIILAQIFRLAGQVKFEQLIFVSVTILALTLLIFTLTVYYLFDFKTAALFAFVYILLPFNWWAGPYNFGIYEISLFFFSLFFLFFFLGEKNNFRYQLIFTVLSGFFLALTGLAREAMFLAAPVFFIYLLFKKEKKRFLCLFIPFFIIILFFWLPDLFFGGNSYLVIIKYIFPLEGQVLSNEANFLSWDFLSHFYPDPYTYHFAKEEYLRDYSLSSLADLSFLERIALNKGALEVGLEAPGFIERAKWGFSLLPRHLFRFSAIEDIGGPLIFSLFVLGFLALRKKRKDLFNLFVFWLILVISVLSFVILAARSHLIDFGLVIALFIALGLLFFVDILVQYFQMRNKVKAITGLFLIFLVLYNLILSSHVLWGRIYDEPHHLKILAYAKEIDSRDIADKEVIAVNLDQFKINKLNYLIDKSMVVFTPETAEKLIGENKLPEAFDKFEIRYVLGYSPELTEKILENTEAINISDDSLLVFPPITSKNKSWLMNLIR